MSVKDISSIALATSSKLEVVDLTIKIAEIVRSSALQSGICVAYVPHTTAGITINENADPDVRSDMLRAISALVPSGVRYDHLEGNSPAHVMASLMGSSVTVIIRSGKLLLGTWQGIHFFEFDGPREREVHVKLIGG